MLKRKDETYHIIKEVNMVQVINFIICCHSNHHFYPIVRLVGTVITHSLGSLN